MAPAQPCHRHVMISGKVYRTVSDRCWDTRARVADMALQGVGRQVLSPMPELLSYWMDAGDGAALCRYLNEQIAAMVSREPERFFASAGSAAGRRVAVAALDHAVGLLGLVASRSARCQRIVLATRGSTLLRAPSGRAGYLRARCALAGWAAGRPAAAEQVLAFSGDTGRRDVRLLTGGTLGGIPGCESIQARRRPLAALLPRSPTLSDFPALRDG